MSGCLQLIIKVIFKVMCVCLCECATNKRFLCVLQLTNASLSLVGNCRQLSLDSHLSTNQDSSSSTGERLGGKVYECKPARMVLEAGKKYSWCTCGYSKKQVTV